MNPDDCLVVIGASHAGAELAVASRQAGWAGRIVLVGDEPELPYHRPPLSKAYLHGKTTREGLLLRSRDVYDRVNIELISGVQALAVDPAARTVRLNNGQTLAYTALALCTGGLPRRWIPPGLSDTDTPANLFSLRTLADADALARRVQAGTRLAIVGGGYVGLELAASARQLGADVTVLEAMPHVLARVTSATVAEFYERVHRNAGVTVHTSFTTASVSRTSPAADAPITSITSADGLSVPTDLVVAGIGMLPNVALAETAGLRLVGSGAGGIEVDAQSRTSDPCIWASGDCTAQHSKLYGCTLRLESVPNALAQSRAAAAALCGKPTPATDVPWFWSDQYDLKLQMVGLSQGHDTCIIRGDISARKFVAFYLRGGLVIAADAVSSPHDFVLAKKLVAASARFSPKQLSDLNFPLKELAAQLKV